MPPSSRNDETEDLARRHAALTGEPLTTTIRSGGTDLAEELNMIGIRCSIRPVISTLKDEEILGYVEHGVRQVNY